MKMRQAKGTHKSMGKKSGEKSGLVSGVAEKQSHKAGMGVEINDGASATQRPKSAHHGSIAN